MAASLLLALLSIVAAPEHDELRLVGGESGTEGLVEVYTGSVWRAVCDDHWDDTDAAVACRQLELTEGKAYSGPGSSEATIAHSFTGGERAVWQTSPGCSGSEERLAECPSVTSGVVTCGSAERAGLSCAAASNIVTLVAIAVNGAAILGALSISCLMAIKRARELKRLDTVTSSDILRSWVAVVRSAPRACLCCCCEKKPGGGGYGKPKRKKIAVRQAAAEEPAGPPLEPPPLPEPGAAADLEAAPELGAANAGFGGGAAVDTGLEPALGTPASPEAPEAKGLRRPLSAGALDSRAAVAQRWMQEGLVSTNPEPKRPAEIIAEARGEGPEDEKRNRRKSNVTDTWLSQSTTAIVDPAELAANVPLDPLEPASEATAAPQDSFSQFVEGGQDEVRVGEEADAAGGEGAGLLSIT